MSDRLVPGEVTARGEDVRINEGRETATVTVANTGDRPVQVGSHFHFFEANAALAFDREAAFGMRLDVPAGTAVRFEPGDERSADLVGLAGDRVVSGMNALVDGAIDGEDGAIDEETKAAAIERAREGGYGGL
ncbi:urease subunit beta [Halopenitus salinus]|uniref:Urease subunit beta n=1 Tax=Halopenitus salinus TaxID=1198295 RepID=A0ABD5UTD0_9EURY